MKIIKTLIDGFKLPIEEANELARNICIFIVVGVLLILISPLVAMETDGYPWVMVALGIVFIFGHSKDIAHLEWLIDYYGNKENN